MEISLLRNTQPKKHRGFIAIASSLLLVGVCACFYAFYPSTTSVSPINSVNAISLSSCPDVQTSKDFSIEKYMGHWYAIQTQAISYQPKDCNCLTATYRILDEKKVEVNNQCQYIDGKVGGGILNAIIPNLSIPSQLKVGPTFIPSIFYGDYWVIDHSNDYSWALISGGGLTKSLFGSKCTTKGLWIFSRTPTMNSTLIEELRSKLSNIGFDLDTLVDVPQGEQGKCNFPGYYY